MISFLLIVAFLVKVVAINSSVFKFKFWVRVSVGVIRVRFGMMFTMVECAIFVNN